MLVRKDVFLLVCTPPPEADLFALPNNLVMHCILSCDVSLVALSFALYVYLRNMEDIERGHITILLSTNCIVHAK